MEPYQQIDSPASVAGGRAEYPSTPLSEAVLGHDASRPDGRLLTACLDNLMRYLLTGCRQHALRTALLLELAESQCIGDCELQTLCRRMSERLRAGDLLGSDAVPAVRTPDHV